MRDDVYLDNQLYFQGVQRKSSVPEAEELKIVESSESIQSQELEKVLKEENVDAEDEAFFETLPLIEEHINEVVANYGRDEKLLPQERKHNSIEEEQFEDALFEEPQKCVSDEVDAKNIEEILTDRSQNQTTNGSAETTDSGTPSQNKPYVHPPIDPFLLVLSASASAPIPLCPNGRVQCRRVKCARLWRRLSTVSVPNWKQSPPYQPHHHPPCGPRPTMARDELHHRPCHPRSTH